MYIKARSISKKNSRYYGTTGRGKEGRLREQNYIIQDLLRKQDEKKAKFRAGFDEVKKELQGMTEEREGYIREVNALGKQKVKLDLTVDELKTQRVQEHKGLEETINSKSVIIEKAKNIGKEEREKTESARAIFNKEVQETRDNLEKELKQRVVASEGVLEGIQGNIRHLEQEKVSLIENNADIVKESHKTLEEIRAELSNTKESLVSYKQKSEKELVVLVSEKKEWVDKVSELRRQADLAKGLISLKAEVGRRTDLLNSSIQSIEQDIKVLNSEKLDLLAGKIKDNNEAEIRKVEVRDEIKGLEEVVRVSKELKKKEMRVLEIKRFELLSQQGDIEKDIKEANRVLELERAKSYALVESTRKALAEEKEKIELTKRSLEDITFQVIGMEGIAKELQDYVEQESEARVEYITVKTKLDKAIQDKDLVGTKTSGMIEKAKEKNAQLDDYKENMTEMYGRLTTTLGKVRETTEELNERLRGVGSNFEFELPPKDIIKIPF